MAGASIARLGAAGNAPDDAERRGRDRRGPCATSPAVEACSWSPVEIIAGRRAARLVASKRGRRQRPRRRG
jgi:hypothetical protein